MTWAPEHCIIHRDSAAVESASWRGLESHTALLQFITGEINNWIYNFCHSRYGYLPYVLKCSQNSIIIAKRLLMFVNKTASDFFCDDLMTFLWKWQYRHQQWSDTMKRACLWRNDSVQCYWEGIDMILWIHINALFSVKCSDENVPTSYQQLFSCCDVIRNVSAISRLCGPWLIKRVTLVPINGTTILMV